MTIENSSKSAVHSSPRVKKRGLENGAGRQTRVAKQPRTKMRKSAEAGQTKKLGSPRRTETTGKRMRPAFKPSADLVTNNPVVIEAPAPEELLSIVPGEQIQGGLAKQETPGPELAISPVSVQECSTTDGFVPQETVVEPEQQGLLPREVQEAGRSQSLVATWKAFTSAITRARTWTQDRLKSQQTKKRLRVCETVSLGEKRFVAVIQVDGERFLVGGSSSSVSTLAQLDRLPQFADVLRQQAQKDLGQA